MKESYNTRNDTLSPTTTLLASLSNSLIVDDHVTRGGSSHVAAAWSLELPLPEVFFPLSLAIARNHLWQPWRPCLFIKSIYQSILNQT